MSSGVTWSPFHEQKWKKMGTKFQFCQETLMLQMQAVAMVDQTMLFSYMQDLRSFFLYWLKSD